MLQRTNSKECGASYAVLEMARQLGLDTVLYSRPLPWVGDCRAMIAGLIVYAGRKPALTNPWENSALGPEFQPDFIHYEASQAGSFPNGR